MLRLLWREYSEKRRHFTYKIKVVGDFAISDQFPFLVFFLAGSLVIGSIAELLR